MKQKIHCSICEEYRVGWKKYKLNWLANSQVFPGACAFFIKVQHWNRFQETSPNTNIFISDYLKIDLVLMSWHVWTSKPLYFLQGWSQRHPLHDHRMDEVGRDLWRSSGPSLPAQVGPHRTVCPGPRQDIFLSLRVETPQPAWATSASAASPSQ